MGFEFETPLFTKDNSETTEVFSMEKIFTYFPTKYDLTSITKITSLDLSNCDIKDLPTECSVLHLKRINLSHNRLKRVPGFLFNGLKNLDLLDLSYNEIEDFDREPDCINNIKIVNLSNNRLKNVPKWLLMFKAVSLEEFSYSHNNATHYNYLKNSFNSTRSRLLKLELINCSLIDSDFKFIRQFKRLRYLDIGNEREDTSNNFREIDELFVKLKWRELFVLRVENLGISIFPTGILWLESLIELHLFGNCISWLPNDIEYMINLQVLDVSKNSLVYLPDTLVVLTDLKIIKACYNFLQVCPDFSLMPQLEILDMYNNYLEDVTLKIDNLKFIDFENNLLNTETFDFYKVYVKKKNQYRETINLYRRDGIIFEKTTEHDCDSEKEESDDYSTDEELNVGSEPLIIENWDQDVSYTQKNRNPNIESDDDWIGEEVSKEVRRSVCAEKVYVLDEDWMFEDVPEV